AVLALAFLAILAVPRAVRAEDDDPVLARGLKFSEWTKILREDKEVDLRRGAVLALSLVPNPTIPKAVPPLLTALREDAEERVRESPAQALGRLGAKLRSLAKANMETARLDDVREGLTVALRTDKAGRVREASANGLGLLESDAAKAVPSLALA